MIVAKGDMAQTNLLLIGLRGTVLALDRSTGQEVWRQKDLPGADFVNVVLDGGELYAATTGEIFCLDAAAAAIVWRNKLPGLGHGLVTIATAANGQAPSIREKQKRDEQQQAAATG